MFRKLFLWGSRSDWLRKQVSRSRLGRRAVRRFMPGESLHDALVAIDGFRASGIGTVLTNLGENVTELGQANEVVRHYQHVLGEVAAAGPDTEVSIKLTHLGLDLDGEKAFENLATLARSARGHGNYVWVDMEATAYTDVTLDLVRRARAEHDNVGVCLQAYLYRTDADLSALLPTGCGIRLVKGAYDEPADLAWPKKRDVDESFLRLSKRLLAEAPARGNRVAIATHDERLIERVCEAAGAIGASREAFEFQLLYGIRPDLQKRLAADGYRVRTLISYGEEWFAWYMRRLAERPANVFFVVRALVRASPRTAI